MLVLDIFMQKCYVLHFVIIKQRHVLPIHILYIQNCKQKKLDTSHLTITKVLFFSATKVGQNHLTLYNLP